MEIFTPKEMRPKPGTIYFLKTFARLYAKEKAHDRDYLSFPITARC